jgi:RHS repeat-associated protein
MTDALGTGLSVNYKYDAQNRRVYKNYNGQQTTTIGGLYERRVNSSGVVSHVMYVRGPGKRVVAEETWTESGSSVVASPVLYHHDDIVGSTAVTNTGNGTIGVTVMRYSPFGLRIDPTNPSLPPPGPSAPPTSPSKVPSTRIGFTGHEMEDELNLINMKGRIYDPRIARFLTPDPLVSAPYRGRAYDRYAYVLNNPLRYIDPAGFMCGEPNEPMCDLGNNTYGYRGADTTASTWGSVFNRMLQGTGRGGGAPQTRTGPDYIALSGGLSAIIGFNVQFSLDRFGNLYVGLAPGVSTPGPSASLTGGQLEKENIEPTDLSNFLAGDSVSAQAAFLGQAGLVSAPSGFSSEIGYGLPGAGVAFEHSWQLFNTGLHW